MYKFFGEGVQQLDVEALSDYSDSVQYGCLTYRQYDENMDNTNRTYDCIEIYDCNKSVTSVVIPAEIDGLPVTCIGSLAFNNCINLKNIIIPDSVTDIACDQLSTPNDIIFSKETESGCSLLTP